MSHFYPFRRRALFAALLLPATAWAQAPVITSVVPQNNALNVARSSSLVVTANQPLTSASAGALQVFSSQRGGRRTQAAAAVVSGNTLRFSPSYPYLPGEIVQYSITQAAASGSGTLARPRVGRFTTAVAGTGRGSFAPPSTNGTVTVGAEPITMALGDVDGDGDLDLLTANASGSTVSVQLNNGLGSFSYGSAPAIPRSPAGLAIGDLDGDGDLDFVTANSDFGTGNTASVRLNNGQGIFTPPATNAEVTTGSRTTRVALGDVDGDGDLDMLAVNSSGSVSLRLNNGTANFTAPVANAEIPVGAGAFNIALGDLDGDGDLDLATNNNLGSNTVSIRLNDGSGNFTAPATNAEPAVGNTPVSVVLGDVDGDGDLDLLTANINDGTVSVRLNDGAAHFTAPAINPDPAIGSRPLNMALSDIDADGDLDLLTSTYVTNGTLTVRLNNGAGSFTPPTTNAAIAIGDSPAHVVTGDIDNDGDLDALVGLATSSSATDVKVLLNGGTVLGTSRATAGQALALYPNPAHGSTILTGATPFAQCTLLDALGRVVLAAPADATGTVRLLLPTDLPGGVYLVRSGGQTLRLTVE